MIFLGPLFNRDEEQAILHRARTHFVPNQVNTFQWNLIDGFIENGIKELSIINVLPIGTWPRQYNQLVLKSGDWSYKGNKCSEVGSVNLPFLKQWGREYKIKKLLLDSGDTEIVIYSTYLPFLKAVYGLPSKYKITMIVTDIPEFYDLGKTSVLKSFFRKLNNKKIYKYIERVDRFMLLTEQMNSVVNKADKPHIVVEGIAGSTSAVKKSDDDGVFRIFYAGTLNEKFGVGTLIDECLKISERKIELHLFGKGDCFDYAKELSLTDSRLVVHGFVTKEELNEEMTKCDLLVNPRTNDGEYTKYSFPSKTMEYMASGIPVVMYKLDGIPDEYDEYLLYVDDTRPNGLKEKIEEVITMPEDLRREIGRKAREMLMTEKNETEQAAKILRLMSR